MNKLILIAIAIVILGGLGLFFSQPSSTTPTTLPAITTNQTPQADQNSTTVEYSSRGFNPNTLTVKAGTTVTWINKDQDKLWVASAPHPTHTALPGFDAKKGILTGESYSYTFTKVGTWGYHNHLEPGNIGEVVVE